MTTAAAESVTEKEAVQTPLHPQRFWIAALVVAWSVDLLFWGHQVGLSLVIFVAAVLAGGFLLARGEDVKLGRAAYVLIAVAFVASILTVVRAEPLTRFLNTALSLGILVLLGMTLRMPRWLQFNFLDLLVAWAEWFGGTLSRAARVSIFPASAGEQPAWRRAASRVGPILRGLLLALPLLALLGGLLASADPIFADNLEAVFQVFDLDRLPEYLFRLFYIVVLAYLFMGSFLHAVLPADRLVNRPLSGDLRQFLGSTESFIVLGSVDLLFAAFVTVQFRYFFGGAANISAAGYTYSEYARRGFFELVTVAVISLGIVLLLGAVTRREAHRQRGIFTGLSMALLALVSVMLVSAFMRITLYEEAYGFTRLRTYTHVFIPWLGVLLLITVALQVLRRERIFPSVLLFMSALFVFVLALVNVDALIARQNLARAGRGEALATQASRGELDSSYLLVLSEDALPVMAQAFTDPRTGEATRQQLGGILACKQFIAQSNARGDWREFHPGIALAEQSLARIDLSAFLVRQDDRSSPYVLVGGEPQYCYASDWID